MGDTPKIDVIIPVFNEEDSIGLVLDHIPRSLVSEIIVCDNGSSDETIPRAKERGVTVLVEENRGYGSACLRGLKYISGKGNGEQPDIIVFLDGDYSDHPEEMTKIVRPIISEDYDLVIGSRALGRMERGAMQPQQIFGNWLATVLIRLFYSYRFTDLGPFRAIKYSVLKKIDMRDHNFGWTVEMQVKAAKHRLRCTEVPVNYRRRIGVSKVSGTIRGTILAGHKILWTIFKLI